MFIHDNVAGSTELVSVSADGSSGGDSESSRGRISADGHYVAFFSRAANLVTDDTNGTTQIYVRDMQTGETVLASTDSNGAAGDAVSFNPAISADGSLVAFVSSASNLIAEDTGGKSQVYLHNFISGETTLMSANLSGNPQNQNTVSAAIGMSDDGRYIVFSSNATDLVANDSGQEDVFVRDTVNNTTVRVSVDSDGNQGNQESGDYMTAISADGRYVAFSSYTSNLVPGTNGGIYVHDLVTGLTTIASIATDGTLPDQLTDGYGVSISADGRFVTFDSFADNLVADDTNAQTDSFVHDMRTGITTRISANAAGEQGNGYSSKPSISSDGGFIMFASSATNLVTDVTDGNTQIFVTSLWPRQGILAVADSRTIRQNVQTASITATLGTQPTDDVIVGVGVSDGSQATLSTSVLTFTADTWDVPQSVVVTAIENGAAAGDVAFTLDFDAAQSNDPAYAGMTTPSIELLNRN